MASPISKSPIPQISKSPNADLLRRWARLLDSRFRIPGTNIRFGLDPILSFIPGLGELVSPLFTFALILQGIAVGVPRVVMLRMMLNAIIDACIGVVPVAGNIGDLFWRANTRNLALLERHAHPGRPPTRGDYWFVFGTFAVLSAALVIPIAVALWLLQQVWSILTNSQ